MQRDTNPIAELISRLRGVPLGTLSPPFFIRISRLATEGVGGGLISWDHSLAPPEAMQEEKKEVTTGDGGGGGRKVADLPHKLSKSERVKSSSFGGSCATGGGGGTAEPEGRRSRHQQHFQS